MKHILATDETDQDSLFPKPEAFCHLTTPFPIEKNV